MCGRCGCIRCDRSGRRNRKGDREISPDAEGRSLEQSGPARCRPRRGAVEGRRAARRTSRWSNAISARARARSTAPSPSCRATSPTPTASWISRRASCGAWRSCRASTAPSSSRSRIPAADQPVQGAGRDGHLRREQVERHEVRRQARPRARRRRRWRSARRCSSGAQGPFDFACATCHDDAGKRIRLQGLPYLVEPGGGAQGGRRVAGLSRLDQRTVMTMQHRIYDCYWQMRMPRARARLGRDRGADHLSRQPGQGRRDHRPRPQALRRGCNDANHALAALIAARRWRDAGYRRSRSRAVDPARGRCRDQVGFPTAPADWQSRLVPGRDHAGSARRIATVPPKAVAEAIRRARRRRSTIRPTAS